MKIVCAALLVGVFFANSVPFARPQSPQTAGDQTKPDSNATMNDAKAAKKDQNKKTPAAPSAKSAATDSNAQANSASTSKPAAATKPATPSTTGMVWVNTESGVYHKPGTRWYGKTKQGKYMTEADAKKAGYHAAAKE
jgi:cytoskeletal protein RodZ